MGVRTARKPFRLPAKADKSKPVLAGSTDLHKMLARLLEKAVEFVSGICDNASGASVRFDPSPLH